MKKLMLASAAAACMCMTTGARAADEETQVAQASDETVVVTGAHGSLEQPANAGALGSKPILDTPFSVTVINADDIAARQPASMAQLFVNDPSVFSFASAGTVNWWGTQIRGLGVRNYYIDDVPLGLYWGGDYPLEAVETVEALKGATGFMYGFGAPGGAILYRTKQPTPDPLLSTEIGWRGISAFSAQLDAGGPVGESGLGYRFNLAGEAGEEYNHAKIGRALASLALEYDITPDVTWRASVLYEDYELKREPFHIYWLVPSRDELPDVPGDWGDLNVDNSFYRYDMWTAATSLDWRFSDDWRANVRYGFTHKKHHANKTFIELYDEDGNYNGYVYQFAELDVAHVAQAMVDGSFTTGPVRHEVVAGAVFQFVDSDFGESYVYDNQFDGNIFEPQPFRITGPIDFSTDGFPYEERQTAFFASDTLYFGEHWQAIVGVRHTYYDLEDLDGDPDFNSGYSTTAWTPTYALLYKPVANATIYASYVESLEGGIIVSQDYLNFGDVLPATVSKQYEIGAKYEGDRFSATAAAFRIDRASQIELLHGDGTKTLTQDGRSVYDGVELIGSFRLTDELTLGLGAIFLDAVLEEQSDELAYLEGNRPAESYEQQFVANVEYEVGAVPGLSLHGNVRYFGDAPTADDNALIIPSYTLVGAGFVYETAIAGRDVAIVGNVNNLLDEKYWGLQNFGERINGSLSVKVGW